MPLLWTNKNRLTRFCQIVADLQSSQRTPSLVVQTGFPTSLIDLFLKNCTRFTKPNSNKPFHRQNSDPPPPETPSFVDCTESDRTESPTLTQLITDENHDDGVCRVGKSVDGSGSKSVLVTFFMMIVIVVSIASFEKLIVGITVTAFALMFLEYAGKPIFLCSKAKKEIKVVVTDSLSFEEIKVVGVCSEDTSSSSCDDGVQLDCVKGDKKLDCSEKVVDSCKISLHESKASNSVKFKSKLKKLLTKKLQCSRKDKRGKESQVESMNVEEVVDSGSKSSLLLNVKQENMTLNSGDKRLDRVGNSDYVILFVIVLVGLVLGRFPALILTMTWFFMLKIVAIRGRSKVSMIKCSSVPNS